jgi:hypothetical protein
MLVPDFCGWILFQLQRMEIFQCKNNEKRVDFSDHSGNIPLKRVIYEEGIINVLHIKGVNFLKMVLT